MEEVQFTLQLREYILNHLKISFNIYLCKITTDLIINTFLTFIIYAKLIIHLAQQEELAIQDGHWIQKSGEEDVWACKIPRLHQRAFYFF